MTRHRITALARERKAATYWQERAEHRLREVQGLRLTLAATESDLRRVEAERDRVTAKYRVLKVMESDHDDDLAGRLVDAYRERDEFAEQVQVEQAARQRAESRLAAHLAGHPSAALASTARALAEVQQAINSPAPLRQATDWCSPEGLPRTLRVVP